MPVIVLPEGLSLVAGSWLSLVFLLLGQTTVVAISRKKSGVPYPLAYADKAEAAASPAANKFNCAQRAHYNTLEQLPIVLIMSGITATVLPKVAAGSVLAYVVGRIGYTIGYVSGDPKKRANWVYRMSSVGAFSLLGGSIYSVYKLYEAGI